MAESGSHRDLLEQNGIYAELWNGKSCYTVTMNGKLIDHLTAQELSLAQDIDYEKNTQVEGDGEEVENATPQPKKR